MERGNVLICTVKITQVCLLSLLVPSSSSQTRDSILGMRPGKREKSTSGSGNKRHVTFKLLVVIEIEKQGGLRSPGIKRSYLK